MIPHVDMLRMGPARWQGTLYSAMQGRPIRTVWGRLGMTALWLASQMYRVVATGDRVSYGCGIRSRRRLPCTVVSIGNLTVGGTGKTPLTIWVARWYQEHGYRVAVLSRGYGAQTTHLQVVSAGDGPIVDWRAAGDEPYLLAQALPGVPVLTGKDRYHSGRYACEHFGAQVLILDDGFQYHALHRDLDIVLIDASSPFGHGTLLPRGTLREPLSALRRADAMVLSRVELAPATLPQLAQQIRRWNASQPLYHMSTHVETAYQRGLATLIDSKQLQHHRVVAFAGIGNPQAFAATVSQVAGTVAAHLAFPDHHVYTAQDWQAIVHLARQHQASCLLTTEKDAVRLPPSWVTPVPLYVLRMHVAFAPEDPPLHRQLEACGPHAQRD